MASVIITPYTADVLTAADVKQQCRIDGAAEDAYIEGVLIPAVCSLFERETRCSLLTAVVEDRIACWPRSGRIDLEWGMVQSVSEVTYLDAAGQIQTLSDASYQVDTLPLPAAVHASPGVTLPAMKQHPAALRVRYVVGFGDDPSDIPRDVRLWLLLHIGHFWANREATAVADLKPLPFADRLIDTWRRVSI